MKNNTTTTYRPLKEWPIDELVSLEDNLWGGWTVDEIDFDDMRSGDPEDGFGAAPDYGDWLEYHLGELDQILTAAGNPKIPSNRPGRGWQRSLRMQGIDGFGEGPLFRWEVKQSGLCKELIRPCRDALETTVHKLPKHLWKSLTWDQGKEMAQHAQFTIDTGIHV